ncbi:MAG: hypothetical protein ACHQTE_00500 [Candidatus Saccharimonadales bacterium]
MAEEKQDNTTTPTMDDVSVMRILLHSIKGLSVVSTVPDRVTFDEPVDDSAN